ncbi:hypothetical protein E2C01_000945 [Portunus trituberculatus]|uniref:Uncharacterized protein n=1 Tax=Portunus trituberculatus TaxID=210409 RepID=A0A5B7CFM9_PORTR|nr:hypothetical protein [Portunus trituberculatus]
MWIRRHRLTPLDFCVEGRRVGGLVGEGKGSGMCYCECGAFGGAWCSGDTGAALPYFGHICLWKERGRGKWKAACPWRLRRVGSERDEWCGGVEVWKFAEYVICNGGSWEDDAAWSKCSMPVCLTPPSNPLPPSTPLLLPSPTQVRPGTILDPKLVPEWTQAGPRPQLHKGLNKHTLGNYSNLQLPLSTPRSSRAPSTSRTTGLAAYWREIEGRNYSLASRFREYVRDASIGRRLG